MSELVFGLLVIGAVCVGIILAGAVSGVVLGIRDGLRSRRESR